MNTLPIYRAIRAHLSGVATTFRYNGQYLPGKENTSYKVPAIYIEIPKDFDEYFYPRQLKAARAVINIHVINNAPFKNTDSGTADAHEDAHQAMVNAVDKLLTGWHGESGGKLLSQQFLPTKGSMNNYEGMHIFSILGYTTELFDRHLQ